MRPLWVCTPLLILAAVAASPGLAQEKIVVLNPVGIKPEIRKIPMAPRPESLAGRTIYIVDTKYPNTKPFVEELAAGLRAKYPETNWVLRDKFGSYMDDDPDLWKEIKQKADGAVVLLGH